MVDQTKYAESGLTEPPANAVAVTPSDTVDLVDFTRGIYIGGTGDVKVTMAGDRGDVTVTYTAMAAGVTHAKRVKRIWATGTTATNIIAEF